MTLAEVWRILLRQWWVILIGLLISAGLTAGAWVLIAPAYDSDSVVMLVQQKNSAVEGGENPYLVLDNSLTVTGEALTRAVTDDQETLEFARKTDPGATFTIAGILNGPFLQTTTEASSKAAVKALQAGLRERLAAKLKELQTNAGAPEKLQIVLADVSEASPPKTVIKRKVQVVAGVGFGGLALTTSLAFLVDRLRARRARRGPKIVDRAGVAHEDRRGQATPALALPDPLNVLGQPRDLKVPRTELGKPTPPEAAEDDQPTTDKPTSEKPSRAPEVPAQSPPPGGDRR